jgi:predicted enzyme related to lactoylglutathione lyase
LNPTRKNDIHYEYATQSVRWFEIYVQDMERAKAFYQNTFQVTLSPIGITGARAGIVFNRSISQTFGHLGSRLNATLPDRLAEVGLASPKNSQKTSKADR